MMPSLLSRSVLFATAPVALLACQEDAPPAGAIDVPSGREVTLIDVITNAPGPEGATARFRFLVPDLAPGDVETTAGDMQALCDTYAVPRVDGMVPKPQQIIISLASEAVAFGEPAPDVVQFFEAYRINAGLCEWAAF
jgi:hypothetical protein